ncbi:MAG: hypothetical protein HC880_09560 [Bacteroidia bacterium]|nr:hypothetical protein [Bacteroidia bacterium]
MENDNNLSSQATNQMPNIQQEKLSEKRKEALENLKRAVQELYLEYDEYKASKNTE